MTRREIKVILLVIILIYKYKEVIMCLLMLVCPVDLRKGTKMLKNDFGNDEKIEFVCYIFVN